MKKARAMYIPAGEKKAVWGPVDQNVLPEGYPYKEQTGAAVEWDGVGEGVESVAVSGQTYYRISELTITHEELLASNITLSSSGLNITKTGQEWQESGSGTVNDGGALSVVMLNGAGLIIARDTSMLPKTGIYATALADNTISQSYIVGVSWGGTIIHTMAPEFLPAGVGGGGLVYEIAESDYTLNSGTYMVTKNYDPIYEQLEKGGSVVIKLNTSSGVIYILPQMAQVMSGQGFMVIARGQADNTTLAFTTGSYH